MKLLEPIIFPKDLNSGLLQSYVDNLKAKYRVPAISLSIWDGNKIHAAASGVLNQNSGVEATTDSVFQIGSVTKIFTAMLIMQLVEAGRLDLSMPVKYYLHEFRVGDPDATESITIRHLLNHTNGLAGDFFVDHSEISGNPLARYLDSCCLLPQVHPVGQYHSYSNSAYVIAGRLIEVMMGTSWFDAIERHILNPLDLSCSFVRPSEGLRFRCAMGHLPDTAEKQDWQVAPSCYPPLGLAPAGTTLSMSATDLVTFARVHLNGGLSDSNLKSGDLKTIRLLSCDSVHEMQVPNISLPAYSPSFVSAWGLGWFTLGGADCPVIGHDGGTIGQSCILRLVPKRNCAFVVQTNCSNNNVLKIIAADLLSSLTGIYLGYPEHSGPKMPTDSIIGTYDSFDGKITVSLSEQGLVAIREDKVTPFGEERWGLEVIDSKTAMAYSEKGECEGSLIFLEPDAKGFSKYLYFGFRMHQRV